MLAPMVSEMVLVFNSMTAVIATKIVVTTDKFDSSKKNTTAHFLVVVLNLNGTAFKRNFAD
jgi:hypothetical protein